MLVFPVSLPAAPGVSPRTPAAVPVRFLTRVQATKSSSSTRELQLQGERHFPGGLVALDEQIQVTVGDSEKGSGSESSECRDQQDRC